MKKIGGGILIFLGLFMLLGLVVSETSHGFLIEFLTFALFVLAPLVGGSLLIRSSGKQKKRAVDEARKLLRDSREKEILIIAKEKGGAVTIADIVSESSMNSSEAEDMLNDLIVRGLVDFRMSADGQVSYEFFDSGNLDELRLRSDDSDLLRE